MTAIHESTSFFNRRQCVLLGLILALAATLRIIGINHDSLAMDEFFSLELSTARGLGDAKMPTDELIQSPPAPTLLAGAPAWYRTWFAMRDDTHPPLHPLVLRLWRMMFGESAVAARALSIAFSMLAILFLYVAVRMLHGENSALGAALVMAVAAPQIEFAQFARDYAMLIASVAACCATTVWIIARGATLFRCVVLALAFLIAMLTHYAAAGPLAGIAVFALLRSGGRRRFGILVALIASALIYLTIWGPYLLEQYQNQTFTTNMLWTLEGHDGHVLRTLARFARLPMRFFFEPQTRGDAIASASMIFYILPLLLLRNRRAWLLWWLILMGAVVPVLLSDLNRGSFLLNLPRYTIAGSIAAYAMVGALVELSSVPTNRTIRIAMRAVPIIIAIACALTLPDFYQQEQRDYRRFGRYLADRAKPGDAVLICAPKGAEWNAHVFQLAITHYAGGAHWPMAILTREPDGKLVQDLKSRRGSIWIVGGGTEMFPGSTQIATDYFVGIGRVTGVKLNE